MKKLFLIILTVGLFSIASQAQNYRTGLGARLGFFNGITLKHFVSETNALEGIANFRWGGFAITGLYEWQKPISGAAGLDYFLGLGAHVGSYGNGNAYWYDQDPDRDHFTVFGVDFIAGLEYTFAEVPFNIGLDWKPAYNFGGYHWWGDGLALSIRYTFK